MNPIPMDMAENVHRDLNKKGDDNDDYDDNDDDYSDLQSTIVNYSNDGACISSDDDENRVRAFANRPERVELLGSLTELVSGLSVALCTERLKDGQPSSKVLICFSGILAFSEATNSFLNACSYTPYFSRFIYI
ncbi:hypothetical protein IWW34DRAFT_152432 [Fusarium oxysporum f. sp. albedinis]|nr:hypothetical protein IWW34DRAFT_152432 [Fusarium oxysporum f. sp. albedinis]